jgi:zinc-ribbon domain
MPCTRCGFQLSADSSFCPRCGQPVARASVPAAQPAPPAWQASAPAPPYAAPSPAVPQQPYGQPPVPGGWPPPPAAGAWPPPPPYGQQPPGPGPIGYGAPPWLQPVPQSATNRLSTAAFICGGIAVLFLPIVIGTAAIICASIAVKHKEPRASAALAVAIGGTVVGFILGAIISQRYY